MTFSYDPQLDTNLDVVRFLLQDTTSPGELANEEITYLLTQQGSPEGAALAAARALYAKYAREVTKAVGDLRLAASDKAKAWEAVLAHLEIVAATTNPTEIYVGGVNTTDRETDVEDADLVPPRFELGFTDYEDEGSSPVFWNDGEA